MVHPHCERRCNVLLLATVVEGDRLRFASPAINATSPCYGNRKHSGNFLIRRLRHLTKKNLPEMHPAARRSHSAASRFVRSNRIASGASHSTVSSAPSSSASRDIVIDVFNLVREFKNVSREPVREVVQLIEERRAQFFK
jgi:hypothetical protein